MRRHISSFVSLLLLASAIGCASTKLDTRAYTVRNETEKKLIAAKLNEWTEQGILGLTMQDSDEKQVLVTGTRRVHRDIDEVIADARDKARAAQR